MAVRVQRQLGSVQGSPSPPPKKREVGLTKQRGPWHHISPRRCWRLSLIWNSLAVSACLSLPSGSHGGLWLFRFIIAVNVFLVSFPGLTCSAWSRLFPPSPRATAFTDPHLLRAPGCAPSPLPSLGLCSMCFARGGLPSPLENTLRHCLAFPLQPQQERRKKGLVSPESVGAVALPFALVFGSGGTFWSLLSLAFSPLPTAPLLGVYPPFLRVGSSGDDSLWPCTASVGSSFTWLTWYSCSIVLQQGTDIGVTPSTAKCLCF